MHYPKCPLVPTYLLCNKEGELRRRRGVREGGVQEGGREGGGGGEGGGSTSQLNCGVQDKAFLSRAKGYFGTEHSMFRLKLVK